MLVYYFFLHQSMQYACDIIVTVSIIHTLSQNLLSHNLCISSPFELLNINFMSSRYSIVNTSIYKPRQAYAIAYLSIQCGRPTYAFMHARGVLTDGFAT